jgi:hypothetical protein
MLNCRGNLERSNIKQHPFPYCDRTVIDASESRRGYPVAGGSEIEMRMRNKVGLYHTQRRHIW